VIVLILLVAVVVGVVLARRRRSAQLQEHFGPEYERSVSAADGDKKAAEAALAERRQRRQEFDVRDLRPEERSRFRESWNEIQRGFVDDPHQSLHSADLLVGEVMRARGYPVDDDFDRRADDLSVDHPRVVQHYREARRIRDTEGEVDTEQQRTAVTSYRSLIDALLGDDDASEPGAGRTADRGTDHVADGRALDDRAAADRTSADGPHDSTDGIAADDGHAGRHALREPGTHGADQSAHLHTDTNGAQTPRTTEEHTR
jgi:hypothetical protein